MDVHIRNSDLWVNRAVFNPPRTPRRKRRGGRRPPPAFPQAKLCCLCELGTHAMLHFGLKSVHWADCNMAGPLLGHLQTNQLLMWDAAFYSAANLQRVLQQQAHLLGRLSWSAKPKKLQVLSDGFYLGQLCIGRRGKGRRRVYGPTVRIIELRRPRVNRRVLKRTTFDFPKKKPRDRGPRPDRPAFRILH